MARPAPLLRRPGTAALCMALAGLAACAPAGPPAPKTLALAAADGTRVAATLFTPPPAQEGDTRPPGLILVHGIGEDRSVWAGFAAAAAARGYLCVTLDLRGHGETRGPGGAPADRSAVERAPEGWRAALADMAAAKEALLAAGANPENLAVAGEGLGATLALLFALENPAVQAVAGLSPALEMNGLDAEKAVRALKDCPALFAAAEGDGYGAASARALKAAAPVFCEARLYTGTASGADLFAAHPQAMGEIFTWLDGILKPR